MALQTPWAILLCKWNDVQAEATPRVRFDEIFTPAGAGTFNMVDFFEQMSHGTIDVSGSQVFGWLTLPQERSDYTGSGANPQGRYDLVNWAKSVATGAGIDLGRFFNAVVCMNGTPAQGTDLFGGPSGVVCDTNTLVVSVLGQEMGHGYGLAHSRLDGSSADYRDRWDTMSTWDSCFMEPHPEYGLIGPGLNAANMAAAGWLDTSRVWESGSTMFDTVVELRPLHRRDLPGYLAARLGEYLVEFRVQDRWDAAIPRPAVLVHRFEYGHSYLMPANEGEQDLTEGSTFGIDAPDARATPFIAFAKAYTSLRVIEINAGEQYARVRLRHVAGPSIPSAGPATIFGGVADDGGGLILIGGKMIRIPPRSPIFGILEQVALYENTHAVSAGVVRDAVQRETLSRISASAEEALRELEGFAESPPQHVAETRESGNEGPLA